ncbi:hypothetical protein LXL04_015547 [Taraxacum kok-saghyz]
MNRERCFQVKGLNAKHTCIRDFRRPTWVNPRWIAKHFIKLLCKIPKRKGREIQEVVKKKFLCKVNVIEPKKAVEIINGKLSKHYVRILIMLKRYLGQIQRVKSREDSEGLCYSKSPDGLNYFHRIYVCFNALMEG